MSDTLLQIHALAQLQKESFHPLLFVCFDTKKPHQQTVK